jgi:glycerophosphoryl diester phosphodiesterase
MVIGTSEMSQVHASPTSVSPTRHVWTIAHRGASSSAPENTLAAVRAAIAQGSDVVELDVQRTKDGALVLMHDTTLARTTDVREVFGHRRSPWLVGDFTCDELRRLDAGRWKSPAFAGERVPTLHEAVSLLRRSGVRLLLELKVPALYPGIEAEVAAELRRASGDGARDGRSGMITVESFDATALRRFKAVDGSASIGLLARPHRARLRQVAEWVDQINPNHRAVDAAYVESVHEAGMQCHVWTVNSRPAMTRAIALGVDGVITDHPLLLQDILRHHGVRTGRSASVAASSSHGFA